MRPEIDRVLEVAAVNLMTTVAPALETGYAQSNATSLGMLLLIIREELDRSASRRLEENDAIRSLFRSARDVVRDTDLAARLEAAAEPPDADLRLSALEAANMGLRALLIELHAHVETLDAPAARELEEAIWRELAASTERRKLSFAAA